MVDNKNQQFYLKKLQEELFTNPHIGVTDAIKKIYEENIIELDWPSFAEDSDTKPKKTEKIFCHLARPNTAAIIGVALGDEGKGRFVDSKIEELLKKPGVEKILVVRFHGGNNAGHTIEKKGFKLALHLIPSGVLYPQATGIMDRGMVIHIEDLKTEIEYVEEKVGSLQDRLFLSDEAILATDLERAEELLNGIRQSHAKGGTGRGIAPAYAHHYDRLGLKIYDLLADDWKLKLENHYERYQKEFLAFGENLEDVEVADFNATIKEKKPIQRKVGTKIEFLKRIEGARNWFVQRNMVINTFLKHREVFSDHCFAVLFEGCQAAGLDAWLGTRPDVTSSNTSVYGIREGTAFWTPEMIDERIGIFKIPYTSSVGARRMPTHIDLPKDLSELNNDATPDQKWAAFIREEANEYGTTTGRPRDINFLDLPFIAYNARMSAIEELAGTHLDVAKDGQTIKVCTHYTDKKGNYVPYQPGLRHQEDIIPNYVELPGWDGEACKKAKTKEELPENALKFLAFIQSRTGFPITCATTGPSRENLINF